ncbi:acetylcholine receptor subunit beta-like 2 [Daphnia magna]|uniref:Uncharacterized protein n=1 Tax=Daphnia magna TaxID=35525 RepID=A0ABQ9ZG29_9CRUS|nr:acetylcholine receptor subunit beta-like 2 [Daphnia magna]KAK4011876.1 hypothetical protein OUZ56_020985 [Daphnia magna]
MQFHRLLLRFLVCFASFHFSVGTLGFANMYAKRLYDDLLSNYNRLIRPVNNSTDKLTVWLNLKLSQLIEVSLRNQVMTTSMWLEQKWTDYRLVWDPADYEDVEMLYVPAENIWLPDIVLYNNADGNYEVTLLTKATVHHTGLVNWNPPAIYKSSCEMDVEWFPFDKQSCLMKFGSWTYDGHEVDLMHMMQEGDSGIDVVSANIVTGINLTEFYPSVEWDILDVPARKNEERYPCCEEPYPDITFNVTMRRKTLFYTVNLIIPCVGITFLTILVFYLPSDSGEKVTLCISILVSLTVFFLLLAEIIPPTSLAVPLLGKYLLFTMILVTVSIIVTVCVLNVHFRSPATHHMSPWVKKVFTVIMPRLLLMSRPIYLCQGSCGDERKKKNQFYNGIDFGRNDSTPYIYAHTYRKNPSCPSEIPGETVPTNDITATFELRSSTYGSYASSNQPRQPIYHNFGPLTYGDDDLLPPDVSCALRSIQFIAKHTKDTDREIEVIEDWKFVAMVLDRFFLWIFIVACFVGTAAIIFEAPSLYDETIPLDQLSHAYFPVAPTATKLSI